MTMTTLTTTRDPAATTESSTRMWAGTWHDEGVEDRALVEATLSGDRRAFDVLVERETRAVYRACLRILGRPHDAEDVTQESFVAAYRAIGTYRGDGSLRGWLLRIATRQSFRRLAQRQPTGDLDALPEPFLADSRADPTRVALASELRAELRGAVGALPEPYREVVALRFFADMSLAEVAETTGRPINTVKTHLRRGLERLRPLIGAGGTDR
jgi:RNA polymerase sigma-70 factor (ECF subfamily)